MSALDSMKERSRRGKMLDSDVCPNCGCESWVRTKALRQICGYCAWPDAPLEPSAALPGGQTGEQRGGHPMSWAKPLRNPAAHPSGRLDLDLLAMRLEADLRAATAGEQRETGA